MSTSFVSAGIGHTSPSEAIFLLFFFFCYYFLDSVTLLLSRTAISYVPDYNMKSKKQLLSSGMKNLNTMYHFSKICLTCTARVRAG